MSEFDCQPGRADDLHAGLTGLAGMVAGALSVDELLTEMAEFAAHAIPGVDGAAVSAAHPSEARLHIQARAVTADFVREIEHLQYEVHHEGPCITSMHAQRPCTSGAIRGDSRWPQFGAAVARLGVNSALSLPLLVDEQLVGAINTYAFGLDAFDEHAVQLGAKFAGPAAVSLHNAQLLAGARERAEQLQRALGSRAAIDQAIGIVRSRSGGTAEEAFARLVRISQSENVKLHVVAQRLVDEAVRRAHARQS